MILEELKIPLVFDVSGLAAGAFNAVKDAAGAMVGFVTDSVKEAMEAEDIQAQLNAVLKSTGGIAGVTADQVNALAASLAKETRFSDDAIVSGQNMLLTFTNIGKDVFPRATETILDMSQALGQDMKSLAIQLGKALNDPIAGITALRRVGVSFTDEQQEMIKSLVESGDLMQAQTLILDEMQKEFGGSATAAGDTFAGQLDILKNKIGDIKEAIGNALLPVLSGLAERFSKLIDSPEVQAMIDRVIGAFGRLGEWITVNVPGWIQKFRDFKLDWRTFSDMVVKGIDAIDWNAAGLGFGKLTLALSQGIEGAIINVDWLAIGNSLASALNNFIFGVFGSSEVDVQDAMHRFRHKFQVGLNELQNGLNVWFGGVYNTIVGWVNKVINVMDFLNFSGQTVQMPTVNVSNPYGGIGTIPYGPQPPAPSGQSYNAPKSSTKPKPRDSGGSGIPGQSYLIGTGAQPELFTPGTSGAFTPRDQIIDYLKLSRVLAVELGKQFG